MHRDLRNLKATSMPLKVAIKYMPKELAKKVEDSDKGSIPLEVALLLHVSAPPACPNIVRLLEWFEQPKHYALILERPDPYLA
ncbi:putative serine/threonine-protein kinase pim-3-like [Triplophysa rosa]|uniref:non-specific serine/threonine protein kinase n=1 Tax=Triplophysa rosa TaxID=992332 RepID=A0A9W7TU99_TRIRA|nr:putative serine/threonine-protein kinase pim-3-like [Triplophysa rosa]